MKIVLYHAYCNDGLMAAYCAWSVDRQNTLCIPITYSEFNKQTYKEFLVDLFKNKLLKAISFSKLSTTEQEVLGTNTKNMDLYLVDIAVEPEKLVKLGKDFNTVTVYDHHKTQLDLYREVYADSVTETDSEVIIKPSSNVYVGFHKTLSGAGYSWVKFNDNKPLPDYVKYANDYDLWIKEFKESDWFAAGIKALPIYSMYDVENRVVNNIPNVLEVGRLFHTDRERRAKSICRKHTEVSLEREGKVYKVAIVNANMDLSSLIGNILVDTYNFDIGITYSIVSDKEVGWSVRSKEGIDSSFLSLSLGGGGHANASGFATDINFLYHTLSARKLVI